MSPTPDDVTICVTSCDRRDLLAETMASFTRFHAPARLLISEDSGEPDMLAWLAATFPAARVLAGRRGGLMASIDRLYAAVETPYIFHLEDDWAFDGPVDFALARRILEEDAACSLVCVRAFDEIKARHRARSRAGRIGGAETRVIDAAAHPRWYGYSSNPGLLRHAFWERYRPVARFHHDALSEQARADGLHMTFLLPGVARHIGEGRHVVDPAHTENRKKTGLLRRWRKALTSRLAGKA